MKETAPTGETTQRNGTGISFGDFSFPMGTHCVDPTGQATGATTEIAHAANDAGSTCGDYNPALSGADCQPDADSESSGPATQELLPATLTFAERWGGRASPVFGDVDWHQYQLARFREEADLIAAVKIPRSPVDHVASGATSPACPPQSGPILSNNQGTETSSDHKPLRCEDCNWTARSRQALSHHRERDHATVVRNVKVQGWSKEIDVPRQDIKDKKGNVVSAFACPKCLNPYRSSTSLRAHTLVCDKNQSGSDGAPGQVGIKFLLDLAEKQAAPEQTSWNPPNPNQTTPWARRHRFMTTFQGEDLRTYAGMIILKSVTAEEGRLLNLVQAALVESASTLDSYPIYFAQLMNSKEPAKVESTRPMNAKPSTLQGYGVVLQQMILLFLRAWKLTSSFSELSETQQAALGCRKIVSSIASDQRLAAMLRQLSDQPTHHGVWAIGSHVLAASMGASRTDASPLAIFLATLGIEVPVTGNFKGAGPYTPLLSRLLYTLRLCFFANHMKQLQDRKDKDASSGLDLAEEFAQVHMQNLGPNSKMSSGSRYIQGLRTFGMASAKAEGGRDQALWSEDGKDVMMGGNLIKLDDIRGVMDAVIRHLNNQLDLMLQRAEDSAAIRSLTFTSLVDNPACADPGMWFGTVKANADLLPVTLFGDQVCSHLASASPDVLTGKQVINIDWDAVQDFWNEETEFLRTLAVAIHLTSGMPSRGSELFETTWKNSPGSRLRGVCIGHNGEVFIDNTYSKADYKATRLQQNVRFLQPTVGRILILYLCTVRQVSDALHMIKHGVRRYYIWSKYDQASPRKEARWDSSLLSQRLARFSAEEGLGARLTISEWRQLLESIAHKFFRAGPMKDAFAAMFKGIDGADHGPPEDDDLVSLGLEGYGDTSEDVAEVAADVMAGLRNGRSAGRAYQQDPFSAQSGRSDEMSWTFYGRNLSHRSGMDDGTMSNARWASRTYQTFFRLYDYKPPPVQDATAVTSLTPQDHKPEPTDTKAFLNHCDLSGSTAASGHLRVETSMRINTMALPAAWTLGCSVPASRLPVTAALTASLFDLLVSHGTKGIRRPVPPSIADAIHCIDRQLTNCVVVSGTGTGKSLTWQVAARTAAPKKQFALLIVPYVALLTDILRTCQAKSIACKEWRTADKIGVLADSPSLVVVSLNRAVSKDFLQWSARTEVRGAMTTVFVDECHVLVEETFRRSISDFARVSHILANKQFIFLTATLPPVQERDLERQICLPVKVFREPTHRVNLAYSVKRAYSIKEALEAVKTKINDTLRTATEGSQVLVISKTVAETLQAAAFLNCSVYHASLSDDDSTDSETNLAHFLDGRLAVLAGTTAAGVGIDAPNIVLVVFLGDPYSVASFAQGAGRAGRTGARAEVVVYRIGRPKQDPQSPTPLPNSDSDALNMFLAGKTCLQQPLTHWLDGRMSSCIELGAEFCSVCRVEEAVHSNPGHALDDFVDSFMHPSQTASDLSGKQMTWITPVRHNSARITNPSASGGLPTSSGSSTSDANVVTRKARPWNDPQTPSTAKRPRVDLDQDLFGTDFVHRIYNPTTPRMTAPATASAQHTPRSPLPQAPANTHKSWTQSSPFTRARSSPSSTTLNGSDTKGKQALSSISSDQPSPQPRPPLRTLSDIGNTIRPGMGSFSDHCRQSSAAARSTSPPASSIARMITFDSDYANQLASLSMYQHAVRQAVRKLRTNCPMCFALERDDDHNASSCRMSGADWGSQQAFRKHVDNSWRDREACFICNMPQSICGRSNKERTCDFQSTKDGIRGILLILTTHSGVRHRAVQVATQINPDYQLSEPVGAGRMGSAWRQPAPFGNDFSMYRAFQAVAAILLMMGGAFTF